MNNDTNDRLWIVLCHLSVFIGAGVILPLIVYLVTKNDPESTVPPHAKETLNFHISIFIYIVIGVILIPAFFIGVAVLMLTGLLAIVLPIVGAIKSANGEFYSYPLTIRLIK